MTRIGHTSPTAFRLGVFAALCGTVLAVIFGLTRHRIESAAMQAQIAALHALVPASLYDNSLLESTLTLSDAEGHPVVAYRATRNGRLVRVIFEATSARGYSGPIDLLVAFDADGTLRHTRVVRHRETPGLGDVIESDKSRWIQQFFDAPPAQLWKLTTDGGSFDAVTGATVSSRAVVDALEKAHWIFHEHRGAILGGASDG